MVWGGLMAVWGGLMAVWRWFGVVWWRFGVVWGGFGCFNGPAVISSLSVATLRMEKFRGEQKNVTRFRNFFFYLFILSVQLCSRIIAGLLDKCP